MSRSDILKKTVCLVIILACHCCIYADSNYELIELGSQRKDSTYSDSFYFDGYSLSYQQINKSNDGIINDFDSRYTISFATKYDSSEYSSSANKYYLSLEYLPYRLGYHFNYQFGTYSFLFTDEPDSTITFSIQPVIAYEREYFQNRLAYSNNIVSGIRFAIYFCLFHSMSVYLSSQDYIGINSDGFGFFRSRKGNIGIGLYF